MILNTTIIIMNSKQLPQQSKDIFNHESYPGMYPGIKFNEQMKPIKIIRPLDLYELKLIVRLKSDIELRSDRIRRAYERSGKDITQIQDKLDQHKGKTIIRLPNNYPYNLKPKFNHWIAWCKEYTWKDLDKLLEEKRLPFIDNAVFYWINDPKFRSIQSIPHYHLIYER